MGFLGFGVFGFHGFWTLFFRIILRPNHTVISSLL